MQNKQQNKFFAILANRIADITNQLDELWWEEHPWFENEDLPREVVSSPKLDRQKKKLRAKNNYSIDELNKLYNKMYPKEDNPEMHENYQQSLLDSFNKPVTVETIEVKTVEEKHEELVESARDVFSEENVSPRSLSKAGASILEKFNRTANA